MKQFILENPVMSILLLVLLCIILGVLIYNGYKRYYDHQLTSALHTEKKRVHLVSPQSTMWVWICCSLLFIGVCFSMILFLPEEEEITTCESSVTLTYVSDESYIKESIEKLKEGGKSLSIQTEEVNSNVTIIYAVNEKGEYVYSIIYDAKREPKEDERFVVRIMDENGWSGFESPMEGSKIYAGFEGTTNTDCEKLEKKIHIYNFVKGENKDKIDYYDEFTIEKGGITR